MRIRLYLFLTHCLRHMNTLKTLCCQKGAYHYFDEMKISIKTKEFQKFQESKGGDNGLSTNVSNSKGNKENRFKGKKTNNTYRMIQQTLSVTTITRKVTLRIVIHKKKKKETGKVRKNISRKNLLMLLQCLIATSFLGCRWCLFL